jgi:Ca-activated chloride channel family protein
MRVLKLRGFVRFGVLFGGLAAAGGGVWLLAQEAATTAARTPVFKSRVDLVVLSFTVTDNKGKYVNGLKPSDFRIMEDGIKEKLATFSEGNRPAVQILDDGTTKPMAPGEQPEGERLVVSPPVNAPGDAFVGTNVFVLFDTSNFMYHGFVYAEDAIADFVRGLDKSDSVAVYTFSRNLSRAANLTSDRNDAIFGLRKSVAGDDTALYNGLLLTLRDAAKVPGRKVVIVFSNGPDNASMVAPDDVRAVAEDEGIPIYVISTNDVSKDPISSNVFKRIATRTGGKAYWAKTWQKQVEAFEAIREDLGNSYTVTYYPAPNANEGFRKIDIQIVSDTGKHYRVRSRPGYRPRSY